MKLRTSNYNLLASMIVCRLGGNYSKEASPQDVVYFTIGFGERLYSGQLTNLRNHQFLKKWGTGQTETDSPYHGHSLCTPILYHFS